MVTVIGRPSGMATIMTIRARVMFSISFLMIMAPFLSLSENPAPRTIMTIETARIAMAAMIPM
jgi:hypothetical protein